ncbi:response regulator transcription factor [Propioniciclava sp. MC1595]|uniref:response regulator transcription factor n=1 Tax=Propioniciclava sp. MC1595 TaxID=2760308 RepID=UPI00166228A6|nr:response regulator transcription factor [Propioniciclava sp. MC1595]MBB1496032.1 response regulator transcription factor [Propioniciclava sp. MC1595]QTE26524.1 response regulator transcription factor [Propioniciclava sp. MC1595]
MSHLLLVEDDAGVAKLLALAMRSLGHTVTVAPDGYAGLDALDRETVDVVLLDVMMPGIDGFETARRMRARSQVPIVMLTARSDPVDIVAGLECGADDYVTKPAEPRVLDARVKAILRRATPAPEDVVVHRIGDLVLDPGARKLSRGASEVPLTPTEFDVLAELADHRGQALSRHQLLQRVWGYGYAGDSRLVDAVIQRLRTKVEPAPARPTHIQTVRGVGYRLERP